MKARPYCIEVDEDIALHDAVPALLWLLESRLESYNEARQAYLAAGAKPKGRFPEETPNTIAARLPKEWGAWRKRDKVRKHGGVETDFPRNQVLRIASMLAWLQFEGSGAMPIVRAKIATEKRRIEKRDAKNALLAQERKVRDAALRAEYRQAKVDHLKTKDRGAMTRHRWAVCNDDALLKKYGIKPRQVQEILRRGGEGVARDYSRLDRLRDTPARRGRGLRHAPKPRHLEAATRLERADARPRQGRLRRR